MAMVEVLKKALKEALVPYYFLAGEKVPDSMGEHKLHCNNRGVDFTEAFANIELQKLNLNEPDETIGCKLVPKKKNGVLAVQATGFKCGGLVLACTFDHQIVDAYSAGMFLVSWAEIARSKPFSSLPTFNCVMLNPRHPVSFDPSLDNLYVPITMFHPSNDPEPSANHFENRICLVKADIINQLQSQASTKESKRTKLESFSALLWKISAKSAKNKSVSKLGIVVDGRTMLSVGDKEKTLLMSSYFGNVLSIPYDSKKIDELIENPLSWVANEVHVFLEGAKTKEHFLDLIDWVEAHRPVQSLAKVYSSGNKEGPALVVSSGQHFPILKVDFGSLSNELYYNSKVESGSITFDFDSLAPAVSGRKLSLENGDSGLETKRMSELENGISDTVSRQLQHGQGEVSFSAASQGEESFSAVGTLSSLINFSGPVTYSGSVSLRSDSSTTSTRSFAFPVLQSEWNSSPVRMAKADRRCFRKHRGWRQGLLCCRF